MAREVEANDPEQHKSHNEKCQMPQKARERERDKRAAKHKSYQSINFFFLFSQMSKRVKMKKEKNLFVCIWVD
jgi:hypothetical protein